MRRTLHDTLSCKAEAYEGIRSFAVKFLLERFEPYGADLLLMSRASLDPVD